MRGKRSAWLSAVDYSRGGGVGQHASRTGCYPRQVENKERPVLGVTVDRDHRFRGAFPLVIAALVTDRQQQVRAALLICLPIRPNGVFSQDQGLRRINDRPTCSQQGNGFDPVG